MGTIDKRKALRLKRKARIRKVILGNNERPRLSVFRSSKHISAQVIDDTKNSTLVSASTYEKDIKDQQNFDSKVAAATFIGELVAKRAQEKGIKKVVFDRNGFLYHGRVKALSDGAREAGLEF